MSGMTLWWRRTFQNKSRIRAGIVEKSELELNDNEIEHNCCECAVSPRDH
jgi:hypothetical protein